MNKMIEFLCGNCQYEGESLFTLHYDLGYAETVCPGCGETIELDLGPQDGAEDMEGD